MNPLPNLNKILSIVRDAHKRQFKVSIFDESKILINSVDYHKSQGKGCGNGSSFPPGNKRVFTFYGRNGHTIKS